MHRHRYAEDLRYVKLRGYYAGLYVNLGEIHLCKTLGKPGKILWGICTALPIPCLNHLYRPIHALSSLTISLQQPIHAPSRLTISPEHPCPLNPSHLNHLKSPCPLHLSPTTSAKHPCLLPPSYIPSLKSPCPLHPSPL